MASISVVILCAGPGSDLANDILDRGICTHVLSGGVSDMPYYVNQGLLEVDKKAIVNHWLVNIQSVSRLLPIQEKVFIVCNDSNSADFEAWAADPSRSHGGFPLSNIISNQSAATEHRGQLFDIAAFVAATGRSTDHLVVIDADSIPGPKINIQRVVERGVVSALDILTAFVPAAGVDISRHVTLDAADLESTSAKLNGVSAGAALPADGRTAVAGPLTFLRSGTVRDLQSACSSSAAQGLSLVEFLGSRASTSSIQICPLDVVLDVKSLVGFAAAEAFLSHYQETARKAARPPGPAKTALEQTKAAYLRTTLGREAADAVLASGTNTAAGPRQVYELFMAAFDAEAALSTKQKVDLPTRFQNPGTWRHTPKGQHPVYTTTNNSYGLKGVTKNDMPHVWSGSKGEFTKTFAGSGKNSSLVTSLTTSKVHKALDDF